MSNWRIDTEIYPYSSWQIIVLLIWLSVLSLMLFLSYLLWWQLLTVVAVAVISLCFNYLQKQKIVHITQPISFFQKNSQNDNQLWFVYIADNKQKNGSQLWQSRLDSVYVNRYLVVLYFQVVEPMPKKLSVPIWRDQIPVDEWRKLQVLVRLF